MAVIAQLDSVSALLVDATLSANIGRSGWLFVTPASPERASYSAPLFLMAIVGTVVATSLLVRWIYHGRVRRAAAWDCGYPQQTARMQDTAEGFGQPIKQIFEPFYRIERHMPKPTDERPYYWSKTEDHLWYWLYLPVAKAAEWVSRLVGVLHHGRIHLYLIYSFVTLLALLFLIR